VTYFRILALGQREHLEKPSAYRIVVLTKRRQTIRSPSPGEYLLSQASWYILC
jgi:hypothetical protein